MEKFFFTACIVGVSLFFMSGCNKEISPPKQNKVETTQMLEEKEFLGEFEEEIKEEKQVDPLEQYNRIMTSFNDSVYMNILTPIAKGYKDITHEKVRESISNFFSNLFIPVSFANNILQGEFSDATTEFGRFVLNTIFGMAGLFDPAKEQFGLEPKTEDFGQTLGVWGFGSGPHIVLPLLGPSNLRDIIGSVSDAMIDPVVYDDERSYNLLNRTMETVGVKVFEKVNYTAIHDGEYEKIKRDAIDLYPYLKNMYEQYRTNQIKE
jgi:phospholipid-binding lipoprotein MlaA